MAKKRAPSPYVLGAGVPPPNAFGQGEMGGTQRPDEELRWALVTKTFSGNKECQIAVPPGEIWEPIVFAGKADTATVSLWVRPKSKGAPVIPDSWLGAEVSASIFGALVGSGAPGSWVPWQPARQIDLGPGDVLTAAFAGADFGNVSYVALLYRRRRAT